MPIKREQLRIDRATRGVTLVEILAVMAILAVLLGIVWVAVAGRVKGAAKQTVLKSDLRQIITAINLYRNDNDSGLPSNWRAFGYYGVNRKGAFGDGYPLQDVQYDKPPSYDVSYHTAECAQPPKASPEIALFRQSVAIFESRPRVNKLDIEHDQAIRFEPACIANSRGEHPVRVVRDGAVVTYQLSHIKSLSANFSGTLTYEWLPDWIHEILLSN